MMASTRVGCRRTRLFAVLAVMLMTVSVFSTVGFSEDSDATVPDFSYTISTSGKIISGTYDAIGGSNFTYVSSEGENVGSWGFDPKGYGPFNCFYAAFDPTQDNRMICHLDPNDLTKSIDGESISGLGYNIMWCLPTVYWSTDSNGNLVLSNDSSKGKAYAHTIDGKTYSYIGIGVYEASTRSLGDNTILTSNSGVNPLNNQTKATFRDYANNQNVNTIGSSSDNGHAMLWNFYQWELYKYCTVAVTNSWNSQGVAGNGFVYTQSFPYTITGGLDTSGPYAGCVGSATLSKYTRYPVKVFIENAWGSLSEYVDGVVVKGRSGFTIDQSSVPSDSTSTTSSGNITYVAISLPSSGYCTTPSTKEGIWGIQTATGGNANLPLYDSFYTSASTACEPNVGGSSYLNETSGPLAGINYVSTSSIGGKSSNVGTRLAFVFDDDLPTTHKVSFSSNGEVIETQVVDSGSVAIPITPSLNGYTFKGWYVDNTLSTAYDFSTPVTGDITLFAKWEGNFAFTSTPTADGIVTPVSAMNGMVVFDATSSEGSLIVWDFGDGTFSEGIYQTHYYSQPGEYLVKLHVYNDKGDFDMKEYEILITEKQAAGGGENDLRYILLGLLCLFGGGLLIRRLF